MIALITIYS